MQFTPDNLNTLPTVITQVSQDSEECISVNTINMKGSQQFDEVEEVVTGQGDEKRLFRTGKMRFVQILCSPGARYDIESTAPTQRVTKEEENETHYKPSIKTGRLDRWLDAVVQFSGSEYVFLFILTCLLAWAFLGIPFGSFNDWQILISDSQAILSYIFDSLLMRQQLTGYQTNLEVAACLQSRSASHKRMLRQVTTSGERKLVESMEVDEFATHFPPETWFGRMCTRAAFILGHIVTVVIFWIGILIWIGFGNYCGWSNDWQLYINSATSATMVLYFSFLANIRERHSEHSRVCIDLIYQADAAIELKLRALTGDETPNKPVIIPRLNVNKIQRVIDYYADLVGTLSGIAILILVLVVWIIIGPLMNFNDNWWLLIGTYTGLIGMNDGFVLRNIYHVLRIHEDAQFENVSLEDSDTFAIINMPKPVDEQMEKNSLTTRISLAVGKVCSSEYMVLVGTCTMISLVIISSAMHWSLTGQLISNVPPSIIETFFMMILITGHNDFESKRRVDLRNIYMKRLKLISYLNTL